jgi:DNA replication and repair protein RecF
MQLTHLSLSNFRNFARMDLNVPGGSVILWGNNAQGKTSVLEAIFYLAAFESFHATHDRQLINFFASKEPLAVARIVADFQRQELLSNRRKSHHLEVRLILEVNGVNGPGRLRKEILFDGVKRKVGEALGQFNAVLFLPQMMHIVEGPPDERRRYLNLALSQVFPAYAEAYHEYSQVLTQRNALLKMLNEHAADLDSASEQLSYWDERLSFYGAQVIYFRIRAVQELERYAAYIHRDLTRGQEILRMSYQPSYDPLPVKPGQFSLLLDAPVDRSHLPVEKIQQSFRQELEARRTEEIGRGMTTIGPHRDEIRFLSNGVDISIYGSRGQTRTVLLSLKLAEVDWMRDKTGQWPVLLLDEVLAELDPDRRIDLLNHLSGSEQVLLTTTDLDLFNHSYISHACLWKVHAGRVEVPMDKPGDLSSQG